MATYKENGTVVIDTDGMIDWGRISGVPAFLTDVQIGTISGSIGDAGGTLITNFTTSNGTATLNFSISTSNCSCSTNCACSSCGACG